MIKKLAVFIVAIFALCAMYSIAEASGMISGSTVLVVLCSIFIYALSAFIVVRRQIERVRDDDYAADLRHLERTKEKAADRKRQKEIEKNQAAIDRMRVK